MIRFKELTSSIHEKCNKIEGVVSKLERTTVHGFKIILYLETTYIDILHVSVAEREDDILVKVGYHQIIITEDLIEDRYIIPMLLMFIEKTAIAEKETYIGLLLLEHLKSPTNYQEYQYYVDKIKEDIKVGLRNDIIDEVT